MSIGSSWNDGKCVGLDPKSRAEVWSNGNLCWKGHVELGLMISLILLGMMRIKAQNSYLSTVEVLNFEDLDFWVSFWI